MHKLNDINIVNACFDNDMFSSKVYLNLLILYAYMFLF